MPISSQNLKILRYYRNVEFFRVFDLEEVTKRQSKVILVNRLKILSKMPWDDLAFFGLNPEYHYAFDFFFGVFGVGDLLKNLSSELHGVDSPLPDFRAWEIPTKTCIGRVGINSDGEFDLKDISLSTLPWAAEETLQKRKLTITQFDIDSSSLINELEPLPNSDSAHNKSDKRVKFTSLVEFSETGLDFFKIGTNSENLIGVLVPIRLQKRNDEKKGSNASFADISEVDDELENEEELDKEIDESHSESAQERNVRKKRRLVDILNSFYLRDLERAAASKSSLAQVLNIYLRQKLEFSERIDIRKDQRGKDLVLGTASKEKPGRWPFSSKVILATNQKAAISWISTVSLEDKNTPLIAVNGPPGTGKTTLIKDLLAKNVVERAAVLSTLESPEDAFKSGVHTYVPEGKDKPYRYRKLIPELCEAGIIVASSNNGAVENISKELPLFGAISEEFGQVNYLKETTKSLRFSAGAKDISDWWGLISLPLGKHKNRKIAADGLIWGDVDDTKKEERRAAGAHTLLDWRNKAPKEKGVFSFRDAKSFFKQKIATLKNKRFYSEAEKNILESELFICALKLHEAWLREVPNLENELKSIGSLLKRPSQIPGVVAVALWEVLFMISPLTSTTLASVERMLGNLPASSLPLCIIDEAGQALPQAGIGLLMRCKKALILGDQQQLMPILSLPKSLDDFLQNQEELTELEKNHFGASVSSIQSLADSQTVLGTYLEVNHEPDHEDLTEQNHQKTWIGLPLTSHRRCDDPMFSISNKISYDNIMEFHTPKRSEISSLGNSCWFDVKGEAKNSHWVPAQGNAIQCLLRKLLKQNASPDCFFITPFRSVKDNLYDLVFETIKWERPDSEIIKSLRRRIGTIHTFQGREADIVFLVLGCDWSSEGAADWAGSTPNLCNVAITRAKRFLYVIGDVDLWHRRGVFSDLQKGLEVRDLSEV